jgi:hypothetical protein
MPALKWQTKLFINGEKKILSSDQSGNLYNNFYYHKNKYIYIIKKNWERRYIKNTQTGKCRRVYYFN